MKLQLSYSEAELDIIREFYPDNGTALCQTLIQSRHGILRQQDAIMQKARKLGLKYEGPLRGGYQKGHTPQNKGKRMPDEIKARIAHTFFKKGHVPKSTKPPGHSGISVRKDKRGVPYKWIRVAQGEWMPLAHHTWLNFMGPIPPGHVVRHRDGDTLNCDIKNLELISKGQNLQRNHNWEKFSDNWNNPTDKMVHGRLKQRGIKASLEECKAEGLIDISRAHIALNRSLSQKLKNDQ
jgi:hypothetical protein